MIYLIGGSARCGKTTLARTLRKKFDGQIISNDAVMTSIRHVTTPESQPDIFDKIIDPISRDATPKERIERLRRRDEVVWRFLKGYFGAAPYEDDDVLSVGCLWPSMLRELEQDHRAVFLVDTSPDHAKWLIHIRDTSLHNNWMRDRQYDDEYMHTWAKFNIARSQEIIRECQEYGYEYFDIADGGIDQAQERAGNYLFAKV